MADIVLVHGAWHGGWCWQQVGERLVADGHRVARPTLTGLADRRHLLSASVNLDTHIADVVNTVVFEQFNDVVLVCHSYGGMPAVGAADQLADNVAALVLLDAMLPVNGRSSRDLRDQAAGATSLERSQPAAVPPLPASAFGIAPADQARTQALLTDHPGATFTQPIVLTGAYEHIGVKHYHRATRYQAGYFDDAAARAQASGGWVVRHHDLDHDMMLTDPDWTVAAITEAVAACGPA
jgi:pimeloyl-ACP methyl ester carboxylesterase